MAKLSHNESRFDSYFFAGDFAEVLNSFTQLVGRPFMVPIYGLGVRAMPAAVPILSVHAWSLPYCLFTRVLSLTGWRLAAG